MMIVERTRKKMTASKRVSLYVVGLPPQGYVREKEKLLQIEPKGAALIKRIFRDYASHGTTYSIADALNGEGISRSMRNGNKRLWTPMDIQRTLRNALYAGYIVFGEELFERQHKALISRAEWERVQTKLNSTSSIAEQRVKRTRPRMVYSLSGLLRCVRCGKHMSGSYGIKGDSIYKYYTCTMRRKYGERGCACPSLNAE